MKAADSPGTTDPRADPAAAELRALLQAKNLLHYAREAREIEEGWREEEERRLDVWRKYEAAVESLVPVKSRVVLLLLLVANLAAMLGISLLLLLRWPL